MSIQVAFLRSTDLFHDSRSTRTIQHLFNQGYRVQLVAWGRRGKGIGFLEESFESKVFPVKAEIGGGFANTFPLLRWSAFVLGSLAKIKPVLVYACDLDTGLCALVYGLLTRTPVFYDQYDRYSAKVSNKYLKHFLNLLEDLVIRKAHAVILPSTARAASLKRADPFIIENCPRIRSCNDQKVTRSTDLFFGGLLVKDRMILETVNLAIDNPEITLKVAGYGMLETQIRESVAATRNIAFLGSLPNAEIIEHMGQSLLTFALYDPKDINVRNAAVSKVYEAAIANTPIVVSSGTSTASLVEQYHLGWVITYGNIRSLLDILKIRKSWSEGELKMHKQNCARFLSGISNWESNQSLNSTLERAIKSR